MSKHRETWFIACGMSQERVMELRAICRQYGQMKRVLRSAKEDGRKRSCARRVAAIEDSAGSVDRVMAPYIIEAVRQVHWDYDRICPPCGERQFRRIIHVFFAVLDKKLD